MGEALLGEGDVLGRIGMVPAMPGLRAPGAEGFQGRAGELVLLLLLLLTAGSFTCCHAQHDMTHRLRQRVRMMFACGCAVAGAKAAFAT